MKISTRTRSAGAPRLRGAADTSSPPVAVLEIGGTHVTAACVDTRSWTLTESHRLPLDSHAPAADVVQTLVAAAGSLGVESPAPWAVAVPDPFDYARGVALFRDVGKFDHLYGVDLRHALDTAIVPQPSSITFVHDAEAFLLGEWTSGAAVGAARCIGITLGTGIGSAFLVDGALVSDGPGLPPGGRIHRLRIDGAPLEDTVSRRAIRAQYEVLTGDATADVRDIAERARAGEQPARAVLERAFRALGAALIPCLIAFEPDVLVVGGSMSASWDIVCEPLLAGLGRAGTVRLVPARHPVDAPIIGAARQAITELSFKTN